MGCRGLHLAITAAQRETLLGLTDDEDRRYYICDLEVELHDTLVQPTDKAWDAIHRCLTEWPADVEDIVPGEDAEDHPEKYGTYPLKLCILGGRKVMDDETNYIIRLIEPHEVVDLVAALNEITEEWLEEKYHKHCKDVWPEYGDDDFGYTWSWFYELRYFLQRTVPTGRAVIFTVSQ